MAILESSDARRARQGAPGVCAGAFVPLAEQVVLLYTILISNESEVAVQLVTRHWIITDATGHVQEVRGPGVVGQQPRLEPGQAFEYTSGCPLTSPYGSMRGSYQMVAADGETFDAEVAEFTLTAPYTVH